MHAPSEKKNSNSKDKFYEEGERVFDHFTKYHMTILLGEFNAKVGGENIFKPTIGNESLHQNRNGNGVRTVHFVKSKNLVIKNTIFPHPDINKCTWTSPDGQTHNQSDHILIDRRWHPSIFHVRSFRGADSETDHYPVVAKLEKY